MTSEATKGQIPDIYGQVHPLETDELIRRKLEEFQIEVDEIVDDKEWLLQAQEKCPQLLTDDFKLKFLRCEVFNADLAAKRYVKYWKKRVKVFGAQKAFEPLTLGGALEDDRVALEIGFICRTGTKDASGRTILYVVPKNYDETRHSTESMVRAVWYFLHAALDDEMTQKRGIVVLVNPIDATFLDFHRKLTKMVTDSLKTCIPVRLSGVHILYPPTYFAWLFDIIKLLFGKRLRKRIQLHPGSVETVVKSIEKYGLPKEALPEDVGGTVILDRKKWLETRGASGR